MASAVRLSEARVDGTDVVWSEGRPDEGGRTQLVRCGADGSTSELLPADRNARTAVHEYGGAAWWVRDGVTWFTDWADQRLYRVEPGAEPEPITAEPADRRAPTGTPTATSTRTRRPSSASGSGTPDRPRPTCATRSSGWTRTGCPNRRCWSAARTSWPRRGCTRTASRWPGCSGTTRRCRGTTSSCAPATWSPARRSWWPAAPPSRCRSRAGARTARCGSSPTAATGGTSTAGDPVRTSRPWSGSTPRSACRRWALGRRPLRRARRRPGGRRAPAERRSTAWPSATSTAGSPTSTCRSPRSARCGPAAGSSVRAGGRHPDQRTRRVPGGPRRGHRTRGHRAAPAPGPAASTPATCPRRSRSRSPRPPRTAPRAPRTRCSTRRRTPATRGCPASCRRCWWSSTAGRPRRRCRC